MPALIARAFFPHLLGYVLTFAVFGFLGALESRDPDYVVMASLFLIGWAAGLALFIFNQRLRVERFLRTLPVTHGEIITARFLAGLLLLAICWSVLVFIAVNVSHTVEQGMLCLKLVAAAIGWSLIAAGIAHTWVAHRGPSILAGVLLNVVLVATIVPFMVLHARPTNTFDTRDTLFVAAATGAPWIVQILYPCLGMWIFVVLMRRAAATSRPRDD